ncbi:hypothetical protein B4U80_13899 [Leptotrombidium deliense]|uniref:TIL domain-containing protein n=1 Tax=Leptotrombidium deliense TaxID=299467 RepID=A0A443S8H0_9ACAR|nr:hypothetical protein B4U80_13899 [Leptotrombidium deliense]
MLKYTINILFKATVIKCRENEYLNRCGIDCSKTCDDVKNNTTPICPMVCGGRPVCSCKESYARSKSGACIKEKQCLTDGDLDVCEKFRENKVCPITQGHSCKRDPCDVKPCINSSKEIDMFFN